MTTDELFQELSEQLNQEQLTDVERMALLAVTALALANANAGNPIVRATFFAAIPGFETARAGYQQVVVTSSLTEAVQNLDTPAPNNPGGG